MGTVEWTPAPDGVLLLAAHLSMSKVINLIALIMSATGRWAAVFCLFIVPVACRAAPPGGVSTVPRTRAETGTNGLIASPEPDWPQWNGPRRDGISSETGLRTVWPAAGPRLAWKIGNLGRGWSSPIIVRDRLYITGDLDDELVIFAFDLDGMPQWQAKNGRSWTGSYPGARASCAYSAGRLYHMNAHGRVVCLEAQTGKELWAVDVLERFRGHNITWAMSESLLIDGTRVLVTPGGEKALIAALDTQSGQTVWTTPPLRDNQAGNSSPLLFRHAGRRTIANCSSGHVFAVDAASGDLLWTVPLKNIFGVNVAAPVYGAGRIFCTTPYVDGACYALSPGPGSSQPEKVWNTSLDTCTGTLLFVDGLLYGSGYKAHKSWLCLDWESGRTLYELKDLTTGAAVYADGRLYCLAEDGQVALLRPMLKRFEVDGRFRLLSAKVNDAWAHPVLHHGKLYLRYHDTLWCYDVKGG